MWFWDDRFHHKYLSSLTFFFSSLFWEWKERNKTEKKKEVEEVGTCFERMKISDFFFSHRMHIRGKGNKSEKSIQTTYALGINLNSIFFIYHRCLELPSIGEREQLNHLQFAMHNSNVFFSSSFFLFLTH